MNGSVVDCKVAGQESYCYKSRGDSESCSQNLPTLFLENENMIRFLPRVLFHSSINSCRLLLLHVLVEEEFCERSS